MLEQHFIRGEYPTPRVTLTYGAITPYRYCLYIDGSPHERFIYLDEAVQAFEQAAEDYSYD